MRRTLAVLAILAGLTGTGLSPAAAAGLPSAVSGVGAPGVGAAGIGAPRVGAAADGGQLGIRLLDAPTNRRNDPRARVYVVDHVHQGAVVSRRVEVSNTTDHTVSVALYAGAATVSGGAFAFADGRDGNELTGWTRVDPGTLTLAPGASSPARVTITVPGDAGDGERYGVIWAQESSPAGGGISMVSRVGVRVYLSVGEGAEPVSDFAVDSLTAERRDDGTPVVVARVRNTGQRALDLSGSLRLSGAPGGLRAGPFPATMGTTLGVGQEAPVEVPLDRGLPAGPWQARLALRSGQLTRAVVGELAFPAQPGASSAPVSVRVVGARDRLPLVALAAALVLLLGVAVLFLLLLARRRHREEQDRQDEARVLVGAR